MKKYAAIDIGTNSMRLLLADIEDGKIIKRIKYINPTRIGSSVDKNKRISEEGIVRNIEAFSNFILQAKKQGAENIVAIATSAVRDAANGNEFIQRAYEKTGVNIQIISGEEEATLGYQGVLIGLDTKDSKEVLEKSQENKEDLSPRLTLVIDIGGGSTELILGQEQNLEKVISLNLGAVRMTERHITTDPIHKDEYNQMEADIYQISKETIEQINKNQERPTLIGIGGTITTLAALNQQLEPYDSGKVHNYKLTLEDITTLKEKLLALTVEEIKSLKGIHPKRADIITAGATILHTIMHNLDLYEINVSEYDNLEGLFFKNFSL